MKYNIVCISDIHWGIMEPLIQMNSLDLFLIFLEKYRDIDMIVILGDYFDTQLPLNSSIAISAIQWMHKMHNLAKEIGIKKIRIVLGTKEHDNAQLEVFRELEKDDGFFKLFNINTYEETLPDLHCIYCPDENINAKEYKDIYMDNMLKFPNIGFFHGSFDVVLPDIIVQLSEETSKKSIIYNYNLWSKLIKGPMISGHWHDGNVVESLIYMGSYDRWSFNEMNDKGFGFVQIDTDTNEYFYKKIINRFTPEYITFNVDTHMYNSLDEYTLLIKTISDEFKKESVSIKRIRILINLTDEKDINDVFINSIKQYFISNKLVKITIKNKLKSDKKEEKKKEDKRTKNRFSFIFDKSLSEVDIIHHFIMETKGQDIPREQITEIVSKYIKG